MLIPRHEQLPGTLAGAETLFQTLRPFYNAGLSENPDIFMGVWRQTENTRREAAFFTYSSPDHLSVVVGAKLDMMEGNVSRTISASPHTKLDEIIRGWAMQVEDALAMACEQEIDFPEGDFEISFAGAGGVLRRPISSASITKQWSLSHVLGKADYSSGILLLLQPLA